MEGDGTMNDRENLLKIQHWSKEIVRELLRDGYQLDETNWKNAVENLSRSIIDLTNIQLGLDANEETTLKATLSKVRIAYNSITSQKEKEQLLMQKMLP
jgi:hypothetical protein